MLMNPLHIQQHEGLEEVDFQVQKEVTSLAEKDQQRKWFEKLFWGNWFRLIQMNFMYYPTSSVTRLDNLLDFGQLFKPLGNN